MGEKLYVSPGDPSPLQECLRSLIHGIFKLGVLLVILASVAFLLFGLLTYSDVRHHLAKRQQVERVTHLCAFATYLDRHYGSYYLVKSWFDRPDLTHFRTLVIDFEEDSVKGVILLKGGVEGSSSDWTLFLPVETNGDGIPCGYVVDGSGICDPTLHPLSKFEHMEQTPFSLFP